MDALKQAEGKRATAFLAGSLILCLGLALLLAWFSTRFASLQGWSAFLLVELLCLGVGLGVFRLLSSETPPGWLVILALGAGLLRLALGVLWFVLLPAHGYPTPVQQAGYVMDDAYQRDQAAWELAQSGGSLGSAFGGYPAADQYGGLLFFSAATYRLSGISYHAPLLMVLLAAALSALGVPLTWVFTRRLWHEPAAKLAAWGIALYPEAALLGSSQMREALMIPLAALALYGLVRYKQDHTWRGPALIVSALLVSLPFSPPFTAMLLVLLVFLAPVLLEWRLLVKRQVWLILAVLGVVIFAGIWLSWGQIAPQGTQNPLEYLRWFIQKSAEYQAYLSKQASGWLQAIFRSIPEWLHLPFLLIYGMLRPLLPAALASGGNPVWQGIAIWRSLGWTVLLFLLGFALLQLFRQPKKDKTLLALWLLMVGVMLFASFRGGADDWDNPRYRAMFAAPQIALAAWAWAEQQRQPNPRLHQVLVSLGLILFWVGIWYADRYSALELPVKNLFHILGLGIASAGLYLLVEWLRQRHP